MDDVTAYLRWMARLELGPDFENAPIDFEAMALNSQERFAEMRPGATDLRCESEGTAWLRMFDTSTDPLGRGHAWLRVSRNGAQQEFNFPVEFTPAVFTPKGAFGFLETSGGDQRLAWWGGELRRKHPLFRPPALIRTNTMRRKLLLVLILVNMLFAGALLARPAATQMMTRGLFDCCRGRGSRKRGSVLLLPVLLVDHGLSQRQGLPGRSRKGTSEDYAAPPPY